MDLGGWHCGTAGGVSTWDAVGTGSSPARSTPFQFPASTLRKADGPSAWILKMGTRRSSGPCSHFK